MIGMLSANGKCCKNKGRSAKERPFMHY